MLSTNRLSRPARCRGLCAASLAAALLLLCVLGCAVPARAQQGDSTGALSELAGAQDAEPGIFLAQQPSTPAGQIVPLTIEEAVEVALLRNYALRNTRLDVENARAQIREAWGQVLPQVSVDASYTRNVIQANPFAGSDIGGLFGSGNAGDWVAFNERARQDGDPSTEPITFEEFQERQAQGRQEAGIELGEAGSNPFTVDNQFATGLSISQTLFNGTAFTAISGAQQLEDVNQRAVDRAEQTLVDDVRQAYYQALLSAEQARVTVQSVERTQETYQEVAQQVARGVTPKFERVSARVELENLRTDLVQLRNDTDLAIDNLKQAIGFPVEQPVRLRGALRVEDPGEFTTVSAEDAMAMALRNRPDVQQAQLAVELNRIDRRSVQAGYLPTVSAFANFDYTGRVPDDRTTAFNDPTDPFSFSQETNGFFADQYWNPSIAVGLRLSWNVFDGFQRAAQIEQRQVAVNQAEVDLQQLEAQVRLQVQSALRDLGTARQRLQSQQANVDRAELNYQFAQKRLDVGAADQLQLREASDQLDQARLNRLQAVYDYLTAKSAFETAVGRPLGEDSLFQFTSR